MAKRPILGLFEDANYAAEAGDALQQAGVSPTDYDFLTDAPTRKEHSENAMKGTACTSSRSAGLS